MKQVNFLILFTFLSLNTFGMHIFIKKQNGQILTIEVVSSDTIEKIKTQIQDIEGIPPDQQILEFEGQILENERTLSYYNIPYESTINLTVSTLGVDNIELNNIELNLYPNPSNEFIKISGLIKDEKYTIYNNTGTKIKSGNIYKTKIKIENLTNGLYFIKLGNSSTLKFIKK